MSGTQTIEMGDRGRLVIPKDVRERMGLSQGTPVILLETAGGLVLLTREQGKRMVRAQLAGLSLVEELLAERRRAAAEEDG